MTVTLLTPIGFKAWKHAEILRELAPDRVHVFRTDAKQAAANAARVRTWCASHDAAFEETVVKPAFSFIAWYQALDAAVAKHALHSPIMNLTAGHGIAISMAAAVAMEQSLDCVCYDNLAKRVHHASPGVIGSFATLVPLDRSLLKTLSGQARTVSALAEELELPFSTTSAAARRLAAKGWLRSTQSGKEVTYALRPGVAEFVTALVA